ncbi:MAG: hypothetical protein JRJ31_20155 [Deltaproteobacteria bacterium]|nr:hypothetical protein [Deltaproteobacteria bacterium]
MRIVNLTSDSNTYTSNVYLLLGDWRAMDDVNTLVDVGRDQGVTEKMYRF